MDQQLVNL